MEYIVVSALAICSLTAISVLLIVSYNKQHRLDKKVQLLTHIIDKGYEHENVDINSL